MFNLLQEKMELYREEAYDEEIFEEILHESLAFDDEIEDLMDYDEEEVGDLDDIEAQLSEIEDSINSKNMRDSNLVSSNDLREDEELYTESMELDFLYDVFI